MKVYICRLYINLTGIKCYSGYIICVAKNVTKSPAVDLGRYKKDYFGRSSASRKPPSPRGHLLGALNPS